ncbi:hypothetical protein RRG08_014916 [Elysia crispata]|uniref:Uncharacterized protein n=1 Tax=Elysia crispata TaxID=231223 RepID=A0AAE1E3F6_9GAST|nr:hypothetical protein RRG08_014916 [Elysia crispata]
MVKENLIAGCEVRVFPHNCHTVTKIVDDCRLRGCEVRVFPHNCNTVTKIVDDCRLRGKSVSTQLLHGIVESRD